MPILTAISKESTNLDLSKSSFIKSLSTTTSILCFLFLSKEVAKASSISKTVLLILTLTKPDLWISSKTPLCSPFLERTTGPKIFISEFLGSFKIWSVICSIVWRDMGFLQLGQ